jgi:hypothetical protein
MVTTLKDSVPQMFDHAPRRVDLDAARAVSTPAATTQT